MKPSTWGIGLRVAGCLLVASAIGSNAWIYYGSPDFRLVNFFSYFTQLSNLYGAAIFAIGLSTSSRAPSRRYESARGAAVLCLAITAIVYAVLLARLDATLHVTPAYPNWVLHRAVPVIAVVDWLLVAPRVKLPAVCVLAWLSLPAAYLIYTLLRGPFAGWYPYPFVDPRPHGYLPVMLNAAAIGMGAGVLGWIVISIGNARAAHTLAAHWAHRA